MQKLQRTGNREREIREFFEGMDSYMKKNYPSRPTDNNRGRRTAGHKYRNKLPRLVTSNRTTTRLRVLE